MMVYTMRGTITSTKFEGPLYEKSHPPPFAKGDRVTWMLQYDSSTPAERTGPGASRYSPSGPLIADLIDHTNAVRLPLGYYPPWSQTDLSLSNSALGSSLRAVVATHGVDSGNSTTLVLAFKSAFSGSRLTDIHINNLPLDKASSFFKYDSSVDVAFASFTASVDSISAPLTGVPEPGSMTLLAIGFFALLGFGRAQRAGAFARLIANRPSLHARTKPTNGEILNEVHSGRILRIRWIVAMMTLIVLSFTGPVKASQIFVIGNSTPSTIYYVQGQSFKPSIAGNAGLGTPVARPDGSILLTQFRMDFPSSLTPTPPSRLYIYGFAPTLAQVDNNGEGRLGVGSYAGGGAYAFQNLKLAFSSKYFAILPEPVSIFDGSGNRYTGGVDVFFWNGRVQEGNGQFDIGFHAEFTTANPEPSSLLLCSVAGVTLAGLRLARRAILKTAVVQDQSVLLCR
jgi:hypothetical protein